MAWTTPRTYTAGETLTAAILNTHWRDDLSFLYSPPSCRVHEVNTQTITTATLTTVTFTSEDWDTDSMHSTVSNTGRITTNTVGRYLYAGQILWNTGVGYREAAIIHSGGSIQAVDVASGVDLLLDQNPVGFIFMAVAEYAELKVQHNVGSNVLIFGPNSARPGSSFMAHWIGN